MDNATVVDHQRIESTSKILNNQLIPWPNLIPPTVLSSYGPPASTFDTCPHKIRGMSLFTTCPWKRSLPLFSNNLNPGDCHVCAFPCHCSWHVASYQTLRYGPFLILCPSWRSLPSMMTRIPLFKFLPFSLSRQPYVDKDFVTIKILNWIILYEF